MNTYANSATVIADEKIWNACLYVRLSREDGDKEESDSITNQKALITEYAKSKPEICICSERVDDGFSGVDFQCPAFIAMMSDIKAGLIDCVIVKDLSLVLAETGLKQVNILSSYFRISVLDLLP